MDESERLKTVKLEIKSQSRHCWGQCKVHTAELSTEEVASQYKKNLARRKQKKQHTNYQKKRYSREVNQERKREQNFTCRDLVIKVW